MARCAPWRCFDTFLLVVALMMAVAAIACWFTVYPRAYPEPERHGGQYPDYQETECRLEEKGKPKEHFDDHYPEKHHEEEEDDFDDDGDVECSRNDRNEWCDADDTWWRDRHRPIGHGGPGEHHGGGGRGGGGRGGRGGGHHGHNLHKRSSGGEGRRFPCIKIRVSFTFRGTVLTGMLYESWLEAENFQRCSTSSCLKDRFENEKRIREWKKELAYPFRCYVNSHKTDEVVLKRNGVYCLAGKPGFHAVLWPSLIAAVCFLWLLIRRCCLCCCLGNAAGSGAKSKPDIETIYAPEKQAGPLPEKSPFDLGSEVTIAPPVGPPPTYDGHFKDVDTVSMMSKPPEYEYDATSDHYAVPRVDA